MRTKTPPRQAPSLDINDLLALRVLDGSLDARELKVGIVSTLWYDNILDALTIGAVGTLREHGAKDENITLVHAPGAFELPLVLDQLAASKRFHALIALGCVIRGGTPHFDYVCAECARGVREVGMKYGLPTAFGVLTCDTMAQAEERAAPGEGNKGREAALAAIRMATLIPKIRRG